MITASIEIAGAGPRDNPHDCFVLRHCNRHLKREAFPLLFSRSMAFFLDHRSTKLIIPESYDRSTCSSCTFNPALPLSPDRRHSVLCGHSKQGAGVCLKPSSLKGNTISSFPKQSRVLFSDWVIGCWVLGISILEIIFLSSKGGSTTLCGKIFMWNNQVAPMNA